jgi:oligopeptidase B
MAPDAPEPPVAPRRPHVLEKHGDRRVDDWYWLRNRDDPEVIAYLEAENAYTEAVLAHTKELRERLFQEIKGRIQETDSTAPAPKDGRWYYERTVEGLSYAIHCRRTGSEDAAAEEVLLDENALAEGHDFFSLGNFAVSPDHRLLAYSTDTTGGERYTLRVRDLERGDDLSDEIPDTYYGLAWASDNSTLFYTRPNEAMRPWQLWRHVVGTAADDDVCVYTEDDERFFVSVSRTRSGAYVVLQIGSMVTSESRVLQAESPEREFEIVDARRQGVEYAVEHRGDRFLVVTNDEAPNFRLLAAPVDARSRDSWEELVPNRDDVRLYAVDAFAGHLALHERADALSRIRVVDPDIADGPALEQPESVYTATPGTNLEFETSVLRFDYTSLVTPPSVFDYDVATGERVLRKQQPVLGGYDPARFATERAWASAEDGRRVPISLVYPRDRPRDGSGPLLLNGYGSYEASFDPVFRAHSLTLLERGFAIAIAHIRGGGELGRGWYERGKFEHKPNTFTDYIACAEHLVAEGWTSPRRLVARGRSAGGLLMGAVVNLRPELFGAVVAHVPFVDVLTTILDESLPLTVLEWEEWGNPNERRFYDVIKSYSPYDNVEAKSYPPMLVTAGLNDPRVSYWEPAKWVVKLRATKTGSNRLLLKTEMEVGHMGPSGRYDAWREEAFVQAFILDTLGLRE